MLRLIRDVKVVSYIRMSPLSFLKSILPCPITSMQGQLASLGEILVCSCATTLQFQYEVCSFFSPCKQTTAISWRDCLVSWQWAPFPLTDSVYVLFIAKYHKTCCHMTITSVRYPKHYDTFAKWLLKILVRMNVTLKACETLLAFK